jgi:hypothetical protein
MQAAIAESWTVPPNARAYDPLLASPVHLTGLLGRPWSAEALAAGLPVSDEGFTPGGVVQPGMDLIEIVPLDDTLLIESRMPPREIAYLRPALDAMVKLSAYDFSICGGLSGRVEHISADAIVNDRPGATSESYYGRRTVLQYLLKPVLRAKENALRER